MAEHEESYTRSRIDSAPNRRKESDIGSVGLDNSTFVKERHISDKNRIIPMCSMPTRIVYTDLISQNDPPSSMIFHKLKYEIGQNNSDYILLEHMQSDNEFYIMIKTQRGGLLLVRLNSEDGNIDYRPEVGPQNPKDRHPLKESLEPGKKEPVTSKNKMVTRPLPKVLVISFYSTNHDEATNNGDIHFHLPNLEKILIKKTVEKFKNYFNKVETIRLDSVVAKYFLQQPPRALGFQIPRLGDKTNFLFLLKQYFLSQRAMHKVVGTIDARELDEFVLQNGYIMEFKENSVCEKPLDLHDHEECLQPFVTQQVQFSITPTSSDLYYFFASDIDSSSLGTVQFMFKLNEDTFDMKYYPEFESSDGLYTNLLRYDGLNGAGGEFHTLETKEDRMIVFPRVTAVNDASLITHMSEKPSIKNRDRIQFLVHVRGELADKNLIEYFETALRHSYMELLIEQWVHTLYLKPTNSLIFDTQDVDVIKYIQAISSAAVAPPSVVVKEIPHVFQTANYLTDLVPAVFDSVFKELANCFKQQSGPKAGQIAKDPKSILDFTIHLQCGQESTTFSTLEDLAKYLESPKAVVLVGSGLLHTPGDHFDLQYLNHFGEGTQEEIGLIKAGSPDRNVPDPVFQYPASVSSQTVTNPSNNLTRLGDEAQSQSRLRSQTITSAAVSSQNIHTPLKPPQQQNQQPPLKINHQGFNILKYVPVDRDWKFSLTFRPKAFQQEKNRMTEEATRFYNQHPEDKPATPISSQNLPQTNSIVASMNLALSPTIQHTSSILSQIGLQPQTPQPGDEPPTLQQASLLIGPQPQQSQQPPQQTQTQQRKSFQLPTRRFTMSVEFTRSAVTLTSYNLKEELFTKLLDRLLAEVTFHELREKLLLGLATQALGLQIKQRSLFPEHSLLYGETVSARSDLVLDEIRKKKKQNAEAAMRMRAAQAKQEYNQSDEDLAKNSKSTFTDRILSMLEPVSELNSAATIETTPANPKYPELAMKISQSIDTIISSIHLKIQTKEIDHGYEFTDRSVHRKRSTARISELSANMIEGMNSATAELKEHSEGEIRHSRKQSGRILGQSFKFNRNFWKLTAKPTEVDDMDSSDDAITVSKTDTQPANHGKPHHSDQEDLEVNESTPWVGSPDGQMSRSPGQLYKSRSLQDKEINRLLEGDAAGIAEPTEATSVSLSDIAMKNLKLLQSNLSLHIFDHSVRKMFDLEPAKAVARFNKLSSKRSFILT